MPDFRVDRIGSVFRPTGCVTGTVTAQMEVMRYPKTVKKGHGVSSNKNVPPYDKTNKMAGASSEDSAQPERLPSLIRVFVVRSMDS